MPRRVTRRGQGQSSMIRTGWDILLSDPVPGDVSACLEELGVEIHRVADDEAHAKCPAHERRTGKPDFSPSWSCNVESGDHNCFSCGFQGRFTTLVEEMLDCDREEAILWVRARGSIERAKKLLAQGQFIEDLQPDDEPQITESDLALFVEVPDWAAEEREISPESCDHYGFLWDTSRDMWIVPIRDPDTYKLWGWQEKNKRHFLNYPTGIRKAKTLFGLEQLKGDTAILVEAPQDAARIHTAGIDGAVASYGVNVSRTQMNLLITRCPNVIVALDNDRDGDRLSEQIHREWKSRCRLKFWNYGDCDAKDPGDQSDEEILESYHTSISSILMKFD